MKSPLSYLFLAIVVVLFTNNNNNVVQCREADDRSRLLYADDPAATEILEYQLHNAPSRDYSGDERREASKNQPGSEYDEERHIKPYFLTVENGPRVVQFYSPWCGHCQSFKSKYISLYREVNRHLVDDQIEVNFYAVSCSVHHWVCMQNNVKSFPTISRRIR
jgi:thiol-disulfide isomerase/thioredoxin